MNRKQQTPENQKFIELSDFLKNLNFPPTLLFGRCGIYLFFLKNELRYGRNNTVN